MKKCPFCAEDVQYGAVFCKHCRKDLPPPTEPKVEEPTPKKTSCLKILLITCGVLAVSPLAIQGFIQGLNEGKTSNSNTATVAKEQGPNGEYKEPSICDINSYVAGAVIAGYTKYPDEAKQSCTYATLTSIGEHKYEVSGYVLGKNSFGVEGRIYYKVVMLYKGGRVNDLDNWQLISGPEITE